MKLDALLVSAAFLAGTAESFAPFSAARRASLHDHDMVTAAERSRGRKRPRAHTTRMDSSSTGGVGAPASSAEGHGPPLAPSGLPPRLQAAVEMLGQDADLKSKSKLIVELGDAFARTDAAVLPTATPAGDDATSNSPASDAAADGWLSQKVPGCVSEVYVAVRVDKSPRPPRGAPAVEDSLGAGGGGGVVSIRGTADARLSRGLLALLALGLQGQSPRTVLSLRGKSLAAAVGMRAGLTDSRINGLGNVLRVIQDQVREHFRRTAAAAAAAVASDRSSGAGDTTSSPALVDVNQVIPRAGWINENANQVTTTASPPATPRPGAEAVKPPSQPQPGALTGVPRGRAAAPVVVIDPSKTSTSSAAGFDSSRSWGDDASSWYPLPGAENEVAMLLSGGVDSSVAMRLLQDQGYKIRAFYLKIWLEDELAHLNQCPWEEDLAYATAVCEQAGVPLEVVPLQKEYWDQVVSYTVREARQGRTPNPDVMCNSRIKFGMFYDHIGRHFRHVATGHYARLERFSGDVGSDDGAAGLGAAAGGGGAQGPVRLMLSPDAVKDQTYFLCALTQDQLRKALFPLGGYTKEKIRELAQSYDLPTKNRKDSQGICFLGKLKFDEFLVHYLGTSPGTIVDQAGQPIGRHRGLWFHTIGQRKGVGPGLVPGVVNLGPWYVADKDMERNILVVTNDREAIVSPREFFRVEALQWISGQPPAELVQEGCMRLRVKTRHGPQIRHCLLRLVSPPLPPPGSNEAAPVATAAGGESGEDGGRGSAAAATRGYVNLDTKDSALAPGQFAAFYLGDECVGSGVIAGWSATAAAAAGVVPERETAATADPGMRSDLRSVNQEQKRALATAEG
eukprot:g9879.t1